MMRQKQHKAVEELYGSKFDASKSQAQQINRQKSAARDCGYIISSNTALNGTDAIGNLVPSKQDTSRRKSGRPLNKISNEKYCSKQSFAVDDGKRSAENQNSKALTNNYDNKTFRNLSIGDNPTEHQHQHQHQQQHQHQRQYHTHHNHHNHRHNNHDEDKDDDGDEFFELIRRTVENAIGKSISELLNRNFREVLSKVESFSHELKNINGFLGQMQNELKNTISHYGEENSRHFRYLCMKSEYDKMFYQHQTLIATARSPTASDNTSETKRSEKRKSAPKDGKSAAKTQRKEDGKVNTLFSASAPAPNTCACRTTRNKTPSNECQEPHNSSSGDISQKSSEVGMQNVLEQIQKYCSQVKLNGLKNEQNKEMPGTSQQRKIMRHKDLIKINKEIFSIEDGEEDDEDWDVSSDDGMTPRNMLNEIQNYASNTTKSSTTPQGNNGAGDG